MAPMEGITGYIYRSAQHQVFTGADKYFTPFITPNQTRKMTSRELNDILPEHNHEMCIVPQIMTNRAEDFIWAAKRCHELGYQEINLNLGCPSGTVVSKGRGSGFLAEPLKLDRFLDQVSTEMDQNKIAFSVKTRIGKDAPEEFEDLMTIYNRYPLKELVIHPRIQRDYYKNQVNMDVFNQAVRDSRNQVCYNGDLFNRKRCIKFQEQNPEVTYIMLGRGVIANPALFGELKNGELLNKECLNEFHELVLEGYQRVIPGDRNVLFKMKELWSYLRCSFADSDKHLKKIRKAANVEDYRLAVQRILDELTLKEIAGYDTPQGNNAVG